MSHSKKDKYRIFRFFLLVMFIATPLLLQGSYSIADMQQPPNISNNSIKTPIPLTIMPKDQYGMVDWVKGAKDGLILPLASLNNDDIKNNSLNLQAIIMKPNKGEIADIMFPHALHADWLNCESCHDSTFTKKPAATEDLSMASIKKDAFCGACHGKVSFR